jgi:hypothetical protein
VKVKGGTADAVEVVDGLIAGDRIAENVTSQGGQ